jgi:uncharacterized cupin superfamily protein
VSAREVTATARPSQAVSDGVGWRVRRLSDAAGLTQMGVAIREIQPGLAGTHLHFHDVEEEWSYVLSGHGRVRIGPLTLPVRAGNLVAFPPGPRPHHFLAEGDQPLVLIEGGERRTKADCRTYPELGVRVRNDEEESIDRAALPAFEGEVSQVVHLCDVKEQTRPHPLTPTAIRHQRGIDQAAGLQRQACAWVRLDHGVESTTYHTHERTDEWVFLLAGRAEVRLGEQWYPVAAGDFIAHPAGGPAHVMRAQSDLTYLMGGEHLPDDVVTYPELGMQLTAAGFERIKR